MKTWLAILACCFLPFAFAAGSGEKHAFAAITEDNGGEWRPLFDSLAGQAPIFSEFIEKRWFPFRNAPVELTGELRLSPDHGLSLHYVEPRKRTMIVDDEGVLLRDDQGRTRTPPSDPRNPDIGGELLTILSFDLDQLLDRYELEAAGSTDDWKLQLTPKHSATRRAIGQITVSGSENTVKHLEFRRSGTQRIEIEIGATTTQTEFTSEELETHFR